MFVSSTRGELAGVLTSVSGIIPPATGEPYLLSCIYHLTLYLLPSRAEIGTCHDFQLPAWRGSAMGYHRTKHKPLFLGYWAKGGRHRARLASSFHSLAQKQKLLSSRAERQALMRKHELTWQAFSV